MKNTDNKPSSNWQSLQKELNATGNPKEKRSRKRQKTSHSSARASLASTSSEAVLSASPPPTGDVSLHSDTVKALRSLIFSPIPFPPSLSEKDRQPGPYVALDCEMVGVGPMGSESTLARVSVVNFFGAVLLDEFVRQKERVTDWRTQWSGIRAKDMVNAKPFEEVQSTVAELIKDRVIVGHAIQNDLKALMLSHPRAQIRDTQLLAHKHGQSRSSRPALRNLVREMLGAQIQEGEHSSVTDARATIAVYRLHRKQWEKGYSVVPIRVQKGKAKAEPSPEETPTTDISQKRTHTSTEEQNEDNAERPAKTSRLPKSGSVPKGVAIQRKGVSSGLSTVVRRRAKGKDGVGGTKAKWWTELGSGKSKGSIKISV